MGSFRSCHTLVRVNTVWLHYNNNIMNIVYHSKGYTINGNSYSSSNNNPHYLNPCNSIATTYKVTTQSRFLDSQYITNCLRYSHSRYLNYRYKNNLRRRLLYGQLLSYTIYMHVLFTSKDYLILHWWWYCEIFLYIWSKHRCISWNNYGIFALVVYLIGV